jgi:hypothetical protein
MKPRLLYLWGICIFHLFSSVLCATILTFEDLPYNTIISGETYGGLSFEYGNTGSYGRTGNWICPTPSSGNYFNCPSSGTHNLSNGWGCTEIGIQFPKPANVFSAYFAAQGYQSNWTQGIRVRGYRDGAEVAATDWLTTISQAPVKLEINLMNVERIVIECKPVDPEREEYTYGWYGMDDLTFEIIEIPEPATLILLGLGGLAATRRYIS